MKLNIPEKYADLYLKALSERKQTLEKKISEFKKEIEEIENHISSLTSIPIFNETTIHHNAEWVSDEYRKEWPWTRKISFFVEFREKLITSGEVIDFILEKEPDLKKTKVRSSISAALSNKVKSGKYLKFIDPVSLNAYYGPDEWFTDASQPHIDHLPKDLKERLLGPSDM